MQQGLAREKKRKKKSFVQKTQSARGTTGTLRFLHKALPAAQRTQHRIFFSRNENDSSCASTCKQTKEKGKENKENKEKTKQGQQRTQEEARKRFDIGGTLRRFVFISLFLYI